MAKRVKTKNPAVDTARAGSPDVNAGPSHETTAEQAREAAESTKAREAEASIRDRMVDIGRGNKQAGRQTKS